MIRTLSLPVLLALVAACQGSDAAADSDPGRSGRFGSLRDFVLFERPDWAGGPFFLDRFEVTRGDWHEFEPTSPLGAGAQTDAATWPVCGVDLVQARAFAQWRFCRVQRLDEWLYAVDGGGDFKYPWGAYPRSSRANTFELGLFAPLPVGVFESGRRGDGPYDLIGNAAEWTELPPSGPGDADELAPVRLQRHVGLAIWLQGLPLLPPGLAVAATEDVQPHLVVGSDYLADQGEAELRRRRFPREVSMAQGLRVAATPEELLTALAAMPTRPSRDDLLRLQRFVARSGHRDVLLAAWPAVRQRLRAEARLGTAMGTWLLAEFGG